MAEINELFYEDTLLLGPIVVKVGKLRDKFKSKVDELNDVLIKKIQEKVEESKKQIVDEVENVLQKIDVNRKYENIEEVTETKLFIKQLHDRQLEIQRIIKGV